LEHVDDFVGLESFLNAEGNSVNEAVELLDDFLLLLLLLLVLLAPLVGFLANEVIRVVLGSLIDAPPEVGLRLYPLHLVRGLEPDV